jgi:hypothetical protein
MPYTATPLLNDFPWSVRKSFKNPHGGLTEIRKRCEVQWYIKKSLKNAHCGPPRNWGKDVKFIK